MYMYVCMRVCVCVCVCLCARASSKSRGIRDGEIIGKQEVATGGKRLQVVTVGAVESQDSGALRGIGK